MMQSEPSPTAFLSFHLFPPQKIVPRLSSLQKVHAAVFEPTFRHSSVGFVIQSVFLITHNRLLIYIQLELRIELLVYQFHYIALFLPFLSQ